MKEYSEKNWKNIASRYLFFGIVSDILKSIEGGCITGAFTLSFCVIDYMGLALNPKVKNDSKGFKKFIVEYMSKFNENYSKTTDQLYAIRCSIVHTHGLAQSTKTLKIFPSYTYLESTNHLKVDDNKILKDGRKGFIISLANLTTDLICGIELFFRNYPLDKNLSEWIQKLTLCKLFPDELFLIKLDGYTNDNWKHLKNHHAYLEILDDNDDIYTTRIKLLEKINHSIQKNITDKLSERYQRKINL